MLKVNSFVNYLNILHLSSEIDFFCISDVNLQIINQISSTEY
jgi:hypothetical protein